ncbi:NAD(P)H-quinone oxidoreductase subunit 5, chloroplastic [Globodera pallida]|nr:NAD(P)H-quinone oxidoreductase subunit 5, chloroplastic [Globodera pallida]
MWLFSVGRGAEGGRDGLHRLKIHSIEVPQVSTKSAVAAWNGTAAEQPGRGPGRVTTIDLKELRRSDEDARHKGMEQQQRLQVPLQAGGVQIEKGAEGGRKNADKVESGRHREEQKERIIENKEDNEKEGRTGGGKGEADDMIWLETESNKEAENTGKEKNGEKEESDRKAKLDETATELESEGDDERNEGEESEQVYIAPEEKPAEEERPKNSREWEGREKEKETDKKKKEQREVEKETEVLQSPILTQNIPQQNVQTLSQQQFSQQQIQLQHQQQAVPPQTQQTQGGQLQKAALPQIQQVRGGQKYHVPLPKVQKIQRGQSQHAPLPQIQQVQGRQPQQTLSLQAQQVQAGQPHEAPPPQIQQNVQQQQQQQDLLPQDQQVHGGEPQQAPLLQAQIKGHSQQVPLSEIEQVQGGEPQKTPPPQAQQVNSGQPQQTAPPQTQQIQGRQPQEVVSPQVQQVQGGQRYHVRLPQVQQVQGRQLQQPLSLQAQQVQAAQPHEAPPSQIQQGAQQQQAPSSQIQQIQGGQPKEVAPPQVQQVQGGQPQQIQQEQGVQPQQAPPLQAQPEQGEQPQQAQIQQGVGGVQSQQALAPQVQQVQEGQKQQAPPLQTQKEQIGLPQEASPIQIQQIQGEQPQKATPQSHLSLQEPHNEHEQQQQHVQRQRLDLFQNISDHKTDVPHAASPHSQAAQQTQEIQSRAQHNDGHHQQIQPQNLDPAQSSSTPPLSPPNVLMPGNASSPLTVASVPVSGGEGALSDLFTLHHLQQQGGGGGGGGSGREEVARKMLPVWGGLIDDSSRLQPITLEEMQGGNSTEVREEGGGEQLADGEEREAAGTEASPHQQQQAGRLAPTRADVSPHQQQQQMSGLAPTVPVGMQQDTALMTNGPAMASGHTQQPPPTPALADPNTPPTVSARSPLPELVPLVRSSTVSPASPLPPPQQKALVPPIMPDTLENVRDAEVLCSLPPDAGACRQYVPKWFFNAQTGLCEQFSFGGCQGNQNNFAEREQCETKCKKVQQLTNSHQLLPEKCSLEREEGTGGGYHVQWYFNVRNLRCEQFVWQGQSGNENRFSTNDECEAMCKFFQLPGVPHPQNVVTNARTPPTLPSIDQQQKSREVGAVQAQNANDEGEDQQQQTEHENELPLAKAATIALTENAQGAIGMPALAQAIGEMPTLSAEPAAPAPAPASLQAPPSLPSSGTASGYSSYSAQPLPKMPQQLPANLPPMLGPSPPAVIDYQTGKRFDQPKEALASAVVAASPTVAVQSGLPNHVPSNKEEQNIGGMDQKGFGEFPGALETFGQSFSKEVVVTQPQRAAHQTIPVCPNGLNAMRYKDGRPVMCLPGMNQCPAKSVCFFNGLDYTCCPNEDDPYDQHVFGGYDGEELKHGYKSQQQQTSFLRHRLHHQHRRVRRGQQSVLASSAFSVDSGGSPSSAHSLRFDDKAPPARINQAIYRQHNLLTAASADLSPCVQPLRRGGCQEASLRYFYDLALDQCRLFYFSGCDGNENNFAKLADCETRCKIGLTPNSAQAQPKLGLGPCPGAELPLGGKNPVLCGDRSDSIGCPSGYFCADGPPSVCCPGQKSSELRRKPSIGAPGGAADKQLEVKASNDEEDAARTMLADLPAICPDGSDPMKNDTSGELLVCGAGIELDGQAMCSRGFFCSINTDRNLRMCCPLVSQGSQLSSSSEIVAPHFGIRSSNPGEVVGQGSAPFDRRTSKGTPSNVPTTTGTEAKSNSQSAQPLDAPSQPASAAARAAGAPTEFAHLLIAGAKKGGDAAATEQLKLAEPKEGEGDIGIQDPFEVNRTSKTESIQNFCRLRPIEGRQCRAGEPSPPSHLQYFFDSKERKCKVFFHRGCGGNANRFSTRQQCESRCGSARSRH